MSHSFRTWISLLFVAKLAFPIPEVVIAYNEGADRDYFFFGKIVFSILTVGVLIYIWTSPKLKLSDHG